VPSQITARAFALAARSLRRFGAQALWSIWIAPESTFQKGASAGSCAEALPRQERRRFDCGCMRVFHRRQRQMI
jgi:hypothetical protein